MFVDSHCHLDWHSLRDETDDIVRRAAHNKIGRFLTIAIDEESIKRSTALAARYDEVFCSVGVHPLSVAHHAPFDENFLLNAARAPKVIALGETGLDYLKGSDNKSQQREAFMAHVGASRQSGLPIIIHMRNAEQDLIALLRDEYEQDENGRSGILHCFDGSADLLDCALPRGFYVSLSGLVTFKRRDDLRVLVKEHIPLNRLLLETDAPFLAPQPHRGKRNEPAFLLHTARTVAEVKNMELDELACLTSANFDRLFALSHDS